MSTITTQERDRLSAYLGPRDVSAFHALDYAGITVSDDPPKRTITQEQFDAALRRAHVSRSEHGTVFDFLTAQRVERHGRVERAHRLRRAAPGAHPRRAGTRDQGPGRVMVPRDRLALRPGRYSASPPEHDLDELLTDRLREALTICFEVQPNGWVSAWIVEVPGAVSQGRSHGEAYLNVLDALDELDRSIRPAS